MKLYPVTDPAFRPYGRIVTGLDTAKAEILQALAGTPLLDGTDYVETVVRLHRLAMHGSDVRSDPAWEAFSKQNTTTGHYFRGAE